MKSRIASFGSTKMICCKSWWATYLQLSAADGNISSFDICNFNMFFLNYMTCTFSSFSQEFCSNTSIRHFPVKLEVMKTAVIIATESVLFVCADSFIVFTSFFVLGCTKSQAIFSLLLKIIVMKPNFCLELLRYNSM